jgi:hypothetical protein
MDFENIWYRIKKETGIKNLNELAEKIGMSQPSVSRIKKEGVFPAGWAYEIARQYGLLTEWIMTGEGPKRLNEVDELSPKPTENGERGIIEEWGQYVRETGQEGRTVLRLSQESSDFKEWYSQQEEAKRIKKSRVA